MNRAQENRVMLALGALVLALVVLILVFRTGGGATVGPFVAPTPTPVVSDQSKADAVALLGTAVQARADDQLESALALGSQALASWPQYDAAQRFMLTAVPQATGVAQTVQVRAKMAADAEQRRGHAGEVARQTYGSRAGLFLQRYADALGDFTARSREARDQPRLTQDSEWQYRMTIAMRTMQDAASALTTLAPVPPGMDTSAMLFEQIATQTAQLGQEYTSGLPLASVRTDQIRALLTQANVELRRTPPTAP